MPKIALAHDYLTQRGGAERVVLELSTIFPDAPIYTSLYDPDSTYAEFREKRIVTSPLNRIGLFRRDHRYALPFLNASFRHLRIPHDVDLVICSSSGWAHAVARSTPTIVYCHNVARWLYQEGEFLLDQPPAAQTALRILGARLRAQDRRNARAARAYVANSDVVAGRIRSAYGIESQVINPPSGLKANGPIEAVESIQGEFALTVARKKGYKNTRIVVEAARRANIQLVVVGTSDLPIHPGLITLDSVSDDQLRWLYTNACMLVAASFEDFGLTPLEATVFGTPTLALRAGGYLETVRDGVSGSYFDCLDPDEIAEGINLMRRAKFDADAMVEHARKFSSEDFRNQILAVIDTQLPSTPA